MTTSNPDTKPARSLAFFGTRQDALMRDFVRLAKLHLDVAHLIHIEPSGNTKTNRTRLMPKGRLDVVSTEVLGFERVPISLRMVGKELAARLEDSAPDTVLAVDMGWGLQTASAAGNFQDWMGVAQELAEKSRRTIVSLYNRSLLIDEHLFAALRGHSAVLTAEKSLADLEPWLERARSSLVAAFANGVAKDRVAVDASISSPWSNGQTEGQITKLKLVKRQMYGRGKIDLLQARVIGDG